MAQANPTVDAFFTTTYTQADARRRVNLLELAVEKALYTKGDTDSLEKVVNRLEMNPEDRVVIKKFVLHKDIPKDPQGLKDLLAAIKAAIMQRPVVTLTVSFEPTAEQITAYGEWFRANLDEQVLVSVVFSAAVVGGCAITWKGKQITYDLEYLIRAKRKEILDVVEKFVKVKKHERVI